MEDNLEVFMCVKPFFEILWCDHKPLSLSVEFLRNILVPLVTLLLLLFSEVRRKDISLIMLTIPVMMHLLF